MSLDDRSADRQADSHSRLLRGDEWLEQLRCERLADPGTGVLDTDRDETSRPGDARNRQRARLTVGHGLDSVPDQVDQDLLHLDPVDEHLVRIRVQADLDFNLML